MLDLTDHFLVAMPSLDDALFGGSVVYITSYSNDDGAIGVIVNKPLDKKLKHAFKNLDFDVYNSSWSNNPLYLGGPVNAESGFVLHHSKYNTSSDNLFELTNDRSVLDEIANSQDKDRLFISAGYSSWSQTQLESEIAKNDWLIVKANPELIYNVSSENRYTEALKLLGINNISFLYASDEPVIV
jgi:putative transcriptional regulator